MIKRRLRAKFNLLIQPNITYNIEYIRLFGSTYLIHITIIHILFYLAFDT